MFFKSSKFFNKLLILLIAICLTFPLSAQKKALVLVYDDSGSMGSGVSSRCNAVSYAIQVMAAIMLEDDLFYVVKMSDYNNPLLVDLRNRQAAIDDMATWLCQSGTPIGSIHTAMSLLKSLNANEKWLAIFTDGEFNTFSNSDRSAIESFVKEDNVKLLLLNIDMPRGSFAKVLSEIGGCDVYHATSNASDIIHHMEKLTTNMMTLPESGILPDRQETKSVIINPVFPLRRLIVLEQSSQGSTNNVTHANIDNTSLNTSLSFSASKDNMSSRITHIKALQNNSIIPSGMLEVVFQNDIQIRNFKFLPLVALELHTEISGYFNSQRGNYYELCHFSPDIQIRTRIKALDGTVIKGYLLNESEVRVHFGGSHSEMIFADSMFIFNMAVEKPISLSISAKHDGYYHFRSNLYTLNIVRCQEITLPQDIAYPAFKVNESHQDKGVTIRPLLDGVAVDKNQVRDIILSVNDSVSHNIEINETEEGWHVKYPLVKHCCFAKTGKMPVTLELWSGEGGRLLDTTVFYIDVQNVCWLQKCLSLILWVLGILFLLWYIIGIIRKPRFSRKYNIFYKETDGRKSKRSYPNRFKGSFISRWLIPYIPEKEKIDNITFKASGKYTIVYISKDSLNRIDKDLKILLGGMEQNKKEFKKDLILGEKRAFELLTQRNVKYSYYYIKTTDNTHYYS